MPTQTHLADFNGYPIEIVDYNNQPWITGEQVGKALGIKHARTGISIVTFHRVLYQFPQKSAPFFLHPERLDIVQYQ